MDTGSLMWEEAGRDIADEQRELSRTAALSDAERVVGQFVYLAADGADLENRLALAHEQLRTVAVGRGYPLQYLTADLTRRWQLLSTARTAAVQKSAASRKVTAAAEQAMDAVAARLAAVAARENPTVPIAECLKLATEAVRVHADAYPLAYESWGGASDGPFTDRAKHWKPPGVKGGGGAGAVDPGSEGGSSTFDGAHQRLNDLEDKLNNMSSSTPAAAPSGPGGPTSPTTAALTAEAFAQRLKNWWHGDTPAHNPAPAPGPQILTGPGHFEHSYTNDLMDGFDQAHHELGEKWNANAAAPGASEAHTTQHASDDLLHGFDTARDEMNKKWDANAAAPGASEHYHPAPPAVPGGFSHADTGTGGGQQTLPTDPADHGFSHAEPAHTPHVRQDWNIPTHFTSSLFE
jgi:hypothetical protein